MGKINETTKLSIALILALVGLPQLSETIYTPALPFIMEGLTASAHAVEATLAIYFLGFALGVTLWGAISDRLGRRAVMLLGLVIYAIACVACGVANNIAALLCWRFVQAVGASVGSVITMTMLRDVYDGARRAQLFAVLGGALAFSPAIGPLLGGILTELCGWRSNFAFLTVLAVAFIAWSCVRLPETRPEHLERPSTKQVSRLITSMFRCPAFWGHVLLIAATNGILFSFYEEAPFVFVEQLGMRPSTYGVFGLVIAAATLLSARISYRLSSRVGAERLIATGAFTSTVGGLLFVGIVGAELLSLDALGMGLVAGALLTLFVGIGLVISNSLSIALKAYSHAVGTAGSVFGGCYYILIAAFTYGMSLCHNGTAWPLPLYLLALASLLLVGTCLIRFPRTQEVCVANKGP